MRHANRSWLLAALAALAAGCSETAAPAAPDLARATLPPVAAPTVATAPPVARPTPTPGPPVPAEVELSGKYTLPAGASGAVHVYVTDGECWKRGTRAFADKKVASGGFFAEVIVPQGTKLYVCAAVVAAGKPITIHGELASAPLEGRGTGEVTFGNLAVALTRGKPVEPPAPRTAAAK